MKFAFTEDQIAFRDAFREVLESSCAPGVVREAWDGPNGDLWGQLAELGLLSVEVPEKLGGLGLSAIDQVLLLEEAGRAALPLPYLETCIATPSLVEAGMAAELEAIAEGRAVVTIGQHTVPYADRADIVLVTSGGTVSRVTEPTLTPRAAVDLGRPLFQVDGASTTLACDASALEDRAAVYSAATLLGLGRRVLDFATDYAKVRNQFGKAIGSFQAVQHHLADALLELEFAAPLVYRAAYSLSVNDPDAWMHASMAKAAASDAADVACRKSLQVHGAIGYCIEFDLHMYMKRAWTLRRTWGDAASHRARLADQILGEASA